ncbi:hypothetical protein K474DRAFT_1670372 [Panus rudis PR-1116 ss-1]|nr:hypothetical protein K474DRAFT_1670372 [Panus rudis PR-1116 ss-1]
MAAAPPQPQQAVPPRLRNQNQSGDTASGQYGASNRERERGRNPMTGGTLKPPRMLMSNNPPPLPLGGYGGPQNAPPRQCLRRLKSQKARQQGSTASECNGNRLVPLLYHSVHT